MLASLCLRVLHLLYFLVVLLFNIWKSFKHRKPKHLTAERTKLPSHLALTLVTSEDIDAKTKEKSFVECIARAVTWCQAVGITQLSVYDREGAYQAIVIQPIDIDIYAGIAFKCSQVIRMHLIADRLPCEDDTDSELEYPLTPPLSDTSESRPLSPDYDGHLGVVTMRVGDFREPKSRERSRQKNVLKRRRGELINFDMLSKPECNLGKNHVPQTIPLTIHLVSRESSKPAIASVARSYIQTAKRTARNTKDDLKFELYPEELASVLEGMSIGAVRVYGNCNFFAGQQGLPSPDLMIVHHISRSQRNQASLELHGFPPWQVQLTEL